MKDKKRKIIVECIFGLTILTAIKKCRKYTFSINSHSHLQSGESLGWRRGA